MGCLDLIGSPFFRLDGLETWDEGLEQESQEFLDLIAKSHWAVVVGGRLVS